MTCIYDFLTCIYDFLLGDNTASQADNDSEDVQIKKKKNRRRKLGGQANSETEEKSKKKSKKDKIAKLQGDDSPGKFVILFITCDKCIEYIFMIITQTI